MKQVLQKNAANPVSARVVLQPKLRVNAPGDEYEQEADRVATEVMRMAVPAATGVGGEGPAGPPGSGIGGGGVGGGGVGGPMVQRACACGGTCPDCKKKAEEGEQVQTKRIGDPSPAHVGGRSRGSAGDHQPEGRAVPDSVPEVLRSSGQPMAPSIRAFMEPRFGHDFGQVRVHTDASAAASAADIDAHAYTSGRNIVFGSGMYAPDSSGGQALLAHELTHVLQQSGGYPLPGAAGGAGPVVQRQAKEKTQKNKVRKPAPARQAIVEDGQRFGQGQLPKGEFLLKLQDALIRACDAELTPYGRSARNCIYILKSIQYYKQRPVGSLLRVIQKFAHPPAGADASNLMLAVVNRARGVARRLGQNGGRPLQSMAYSQQRTPKTHDPGTVQLELGSGQSFDGPARQQMESSFGTSFGGVRLHTDGTAARISSELGARAFTVGENIAFGSGMYQPGTPGGDALIAHELAHTLQQRNQVAGVRGPVDHPAMEREAERAGLAAVGGRGNIGGDLQQEAPEKMIQRDGGVGEVALALLIFGGEATADVAVTESVIVVTDVAVTDVAAPVIADAFVDTAATDALTSTAADTALDTVVDTGVDATLDTAATDTAATTAASTTSAATKLAAVTAAALSLSGDSGEEEEEDKKKCRKDPCPSPLPISWPAELPYPDEVMLERTSKGDRVWMGIDRGPAQRKFAENIKRNRDAGIPPPHPCFDYDYDGGANVPSDAHHIHPLFLGGEDEDYNLCALANHRHEPGHVRLNNQTEHLEEYRACGVCSYYLPKHPEGQTYVIVGSK